jgi:hypothetical protein
MDQNLEQVYAKIRKLLTFQEGVKKINSQAELENVTARINEILLKYNLDLADIKDQEQKLEYTKVKIHIKGQFAKTEGKWMYTLYTVIAKYNLCMAIINSVGNAFESITLIGAKINVELVQYIVDQLRESIKRMALSSFKSSNGLEKKNAYIRAFYIGAVKGIHHQLKMIEEQREASQNKITALIVSNNAKIDEYLSNEGLNPKEIKIKPRMSALEAFSKGYSYGLKAQIKKGLQ